MTSRCFEEGGTNEKNLRGVHPQKLNEVVGRSREVRR